MTVNLHELRHYISTSLQISLSDYESEKAELESMVETNKLVIENLKIKISLLTDKIDMHRKCIEHMNSLK